MGGFAVSRKVHKMPLGEVCKVVDSDSQNSEYCSRSLSVCAQT